MPFSLRKLTRLNIIALCVVAMIGIATFGFGFRDWFNPAKPNMQSQQEQKNSTEVKDEKVPKSSIEVEVIRVTPEGFEPREINRIKGNVLIVFQNMTGKPLPNLQLYDAKDVDSGKAPIQEAKLNENSLFHEENIDLKEGDFVLKLGDKREWRCAINGKLK